MGIIYHAAKDENNKYTGGKPGDQTKQEVYAREWYPRPWTVVYRAKDENVRKKIAQNAKAGVENDNVGYGQGDRNSALALARKVGYDMSKITTPCNTDCSAFDVINCCFAGVEEKYLFVNNNSATTSTLGASLMGSNIEFIELKDAKYLTSDKYLEVGDILLNPGVHTAIYGGSGNSSASATVETCPYAEPTMLLQVNSSGTGVSWLQWHLNKLIDKKILSGTKLTVDGKFGRNTLSLFVAFQTKYPDAGTNRRADGKCGPKSRSILKSLV